MREILACLVTTSLGGLRCDPRSGGALPSERESHYLRLIWKACMSRKRIRVGQIWFWVRYDPQIRLLILEAHSESFAQLLGCVLWLGFQSTSGGRTEENSSSHSRSCALQLSECLPGLYQALKPNLQNLCYWLDALSAQIPVQGDGYRGFVTYTDIHRGLDWTWALCELDRKTNQATSVKATLGKKLSRFGKMWSRHSSSRA